MKRFVLVGAAAAALIAIPAAAQLAGGARGPAVGPLTRAAVQSAVQARFARANSNRDGFVTRDEAEKLVAAARERVRERRAERRAGLFDRIDANRDGAISRSEFDRHSAARAERREARQGGEGRRGMRQGQAMRGHAMRRGGRGMGAGFGPAMFERLDADKDGRVSLAEASARALAMFDRADADRDGTVTPEERRSAMERFREARQGRRGG